jgi:prepilin-type processing-associated H-X9-DG protein
MSSAPQSGEQPKRTSPWTILAIVFGVLGGLLLLAVLAIGAVVLRAMRQAREEAHSTSCAQQLKVIGVALQTYHDRYGTFPPAYLGDADGKPMHSWRVLLLAHMGDPEVTAIYEQYDFNEPWNGPNNRRLAAAAPFVFRCPSSSDEPVSTNYLAVVGPETGWPGARSIALPFIRDNTRNTIALVEVDGAGIPWTEPRDLPFEEAIKGLNHPGGGAPSSRHGDRVNCLMYDGSVQFLYSDQVPPDVLRGLLTISGGEETDLFDF